MRYTVIIILVLISPVYVIGQTTFSNAVEYNDYIVAQQTNVGNAINTLMGNLDFDSATVWSYYNLGLATTKISRDNIKNMPEFNNATYLKEACLGLFEYYVDVYSIEFKEIVTLYLDNIVTLEHKLEKMSPVFDAISAKEVQYDANFANAQQKFATENNFDLIVSEPAEEE